MDTVDGQVITTDELHLVRRYRQQQAFDAGFYAGITAAMKRLESLANECGGGAGTGETAETYRAAASTVSLIKAPTLK